MLGHLVLEEHQLRKWYIAIIVVVIAGAGILLGVSAVDKKPEEFRLALVYSSDTWGEIAPCG